MEQNQRLLRAEWEMLQCDAEVPAALQAANGGKSRDYCSASGVAISYPSHMLRSAPEQL